MAIQLNTFPFTFRANLVDENQTIVNGDGVIVNTRLGNDIIKATTENGLGIDNDGIVTTGFFGNDILAGNTALIENIKIEERIRSGSFNESPVVTSQSIGLDNSEGKIFTLFGDDHVVGTSSLDATFEVELMVDVFNSSGHNVEVTAELNSILEANSIGLNNHKGLIKTGVGLDSVTGEATFTGFGRAEAKASATTETEVDEEFGTSASAITNVALQADIIGLKNAEGIIKTAFNNDSITGIATIVTVDLEADTDTNTKVCGDGSGNVLAEAEAEATSLAILEAIGIDNAEGIIDAGWGNDSILGTADITGVSSGITSVGIQGGDILLGKGDDLVSASAAGSEQNLGVDDVFIDGGWGEDTFDIQNGTGTIRGGKDIDTLILEGIQGNYSFVANDSISLGVTIGGGTNALTSLNVGQVELFKFAGDSTTISFDDLFA